MVPYDAEIIEQMASDLYSQARSIEFTWTVLGALGGAALGFTFGTSFDWPVPWLVVGMVVGGLVGLSAGRSRSFRLKLEAQTALCQVQIERNTRAAAQATTSSRARGG